MWLNFSNLIVFYPSPPGFSHPSHLALPGSFNVTYLRETFNPFLWESSVMPESPLQREEDSKIPGSCMVETVPLEQA